MAQEIIKVWFRHKHDIGAVGCGNALQAGRPRVRFPMVPMRFWIDLKLPGALWSWGRLLGIEQQAMRPGWGKLYESHNFPHPWRTACCSAPNSRPPATKALHTICGNNTSIVSSSWWWAYRCPKHVEQIISAIKHSVASSWFSSLRVYCWISGSFIKIAEVKALVYAKA